MMITIIVASTRKIWYHGLLNFGTSTEVQCVCHPLMKFGIPPISVFFIGGTLIYCINMRTLKLLMHNVNVPIYGTLTVHLQ